MTWFAVKGPDGEWYHGEGIAFETPEIAWSSIGNGNPAVARMMMDNGYRCVEVEIVEKAKMDVIRAAIDVDRLDMDALGRITDAPAADGVGK